MSLAIRSILQSVLDREAHGVSRLTIAALRAEALALGMRPASAIEARQGGNGEAGAVEDESAVTKADAQ